MSEIDMNAFGDWEDAPDLDPDWADHLPATEWIKWEEDGKPAEGKTVKGWVSRINLEPTPENQGIPGRWSAENGDPFVEIRSEEGVNQMVVVKQNQIVRKVNGINPGLGDYLEITFLRQERMENGNKLNHYNIRRRPYQGTPEERREFVKTLPVKKSKLVKDESPVKEAEDNLAAAGLT